MGTHADEIYLEFIKKYHKNAPLMDQLFQLFSDNLYMVRDSVKTLLLDLGAYEVDIDFDTTKCTNCHNLLPKFRFIEQDRVKLKEQIQNYISDSNESGKYFSTPKELQSFKNFLEENKNEKIDVVIDGLNVAWLKTSYANSRLRGIEQGKSVRKMKELICQHILTILFFCSFCRI